MRILVAEKDRHGRHILDHVLRMEGHEVFTVAEDERAVHLAHRVSPDVILMNLFDTLRTGRQPAGEISLGRTGGGPVILITSSETLAHLADLLPEGEEEFETLPPHSRMRTVEHIQRLCGALRQCKRLNEQEQRLGDRAC